LRNHSRQVIVTTWRQNCGEPSFSCRRHIEISCNPEIRSTTEQYVFYAIPVLLDRTYSRRSQRTLWRKSANHLQHILTNRRVSTLQFICSPHLCSLLAPCSRESIQLRCQEIGQHIRHLFRIAARGCRCRNCLHDSVSLQKCRTKKIGSGFDDELSSIHLAFRDAQMPHAPTQK